MALSRVTPDEAFAMYDREEIDSVQLYEYLAVYSTYEPFYALRDDFLRVVDVVRIPLEEKIFIPILNLLTKHLKRK